MLWFREVSRDIAQDSLDDLNNYHNEIIAARGIGIRDIEKLDIDGFIEKKVTEVNNKLLIISSVNTTQKREYMKIYN